MFVMRARLTLPAEVSVASLREELDRLESEQNLDIKFAPVSPLPGEL
jgi:glycine cleavage system regulatory protein